MYPKTTFFSDAFPSVESVQELEQIPVATDMSRSHLIIHNKEKEEYQYFDIRVPYLILYESIDLNSDSTVYMEFSEDRHIRLHNPLSNYRRLNRQLHTHNYYELTYVLSGRLTMRIEDETLQYKAGECCLCNKNIHHVEVMDEDTEIFLIMLKEEFVQELLTGSSPADRLRKGSIGSSIFGRFFTANRRNPLYDAKVYADFLEPEPSTQTFFQELINSMIAELLSNHLGKSYMLRGLLCRFLEKLESASSFHSQIHSAKLSHEEQIVYNLAQAYRKRKAILSRAEIEKLTGYCSDHVERIVKRNTGLTLTEYGRHFLLQQAAMMLSETDQTITSVCEDLGYSNRTYFNRIFRERFGMSPAEYRKRSRIN